MKLKKKVCVMAVMSCVLGMQSVVGATEEKNQDFKYSSVIWEDGFTEEIGKETGITSFATQNFVNWTVKPAKIIKSAGFRKKSGEKVMVNIRVKPQEKVWIGVIGDNTGEIYKFTTTGVFATFTLQKTDTYRVFVQNHSAVSIQVMIYYRK